MRLGSNIYEKNAYKIKVQPNSHAAVSCSRQYALQWELNFYMGGQDLFLLNPKILIPTCFPVEMAGVIWGNLTNRVRRAPPSPPIPLHSTDWGPEGRLWSEHLKWWRLHHFKDELVWCVHLKWWQMIVNWHIHWYVLMIILFLHMTAGYRYITHRRNE